MMSRTIINVLRLVFLVQCLILIVSADKKVDHKKADLKKAAAAQKKSRKATFEQWSKAYNFLCDETDHGQQFYNCFSECYKMTPMEYVSVLLC